MIIVTILLIEQNMKLAEEDADEIAIMVKGRVSLRRHPRAISWRRGCGS
jgi:ABC-type branched-subunit amino acid transport system ATPase component